MNRKLDAASVPTQERYNKKVCSESQSLQVTAGVGNVFCWVNTALRDEGTPSPRVGMSFSEDTESGLKCQRHGWSRYHPNHRRYLFRSVWTLELKKTTPPSSPWAALVWGSRAGGWKMNNSWSWLGFERRSTGDRRSLAISSRLLDISANNEKDTVRDGE